MKETGAIMPKPLGNIIIRGRPKEILPTNNVFTSYHFRKEAYWEDLRDILNILIEDYADFCPGTSIEPAVGPIKVETEYERFRNPDAKPSSQDAKLTELASLRIKNVEIQNDPRPKIPITERGAAYFGLGISSDGKEASDQIWLLVKDNPDITFGRKYVRHTLRDESTNKPYPIASGIMFANLQKIAADGGNAAGELALLLLGHGTDPDRIRDPRVKRIAQNLRKGFAEFKTDKEATDTMTNLEIWNDEARNEGKIEGKIETLFQELELSIDAIAKKLGMAEEYVAEVLAKLGLLKDGGKAGN